MRLCARCRPQWVSLFLVKYFIATPLPSLSHPKGDLPRHLRWECLPSPSRLSQCRRDLHQCDTLETRRVLIPFREGQDFLIFTISLVLHRRTATFYDLFCVLVSSKLDFLTV